MHMPAGFKYEFVTHYYQQEPSLSYLVSPDFILILSYLSPPGASPVPAMAFLTSGFELPEQDFDEIQARILSLKSSSDDCIAEEDLFRDLAFPPDISSLTYVYSGDDQYERMTFKRPKVNWHLGH